MKCEKSVITMTLHWYSSQVSSLGNCVDDTPTETGLSRYSCRPLGSIQQWVVG